jgi:hypothetical protein
MFLSLARSKSPGMLLLLLLLSLLLWWYSFTQQPLFPVDRYEDALFFSFLQDFINLNSLSSRIIAFAIIVVEAIVLLAYNKKYILIESQTFFPAFIFVLFASSFIHLQKLNAPLIGSLFIFIMIGQIFSLYRKRYVLNNLFAAGLLVSLASLFYVYAAIFIMLIWISLSILRSFRLREWFVTVLGFIFPYLFVLASFYLREGLTINDFWVKINSLVLSTVEITFYSISHYILYGFIGFLVIIASFFLLRTFPARKIYIRMYYEIFWWMFVLSLAMFFVPKYISSAGIIYFIGLPVSFLLGNYFTNIRSKSAGNIFIGLLFLLVIFVHVNHYIL